VNLSQEPDQEDSLRRRFTRGAFWSLAGIAGSRICTFLGAIIAARFLGQTGFGELAIIQSTIGLMGTFTGLGIGLTAIRYVADLSRQEPDRTGRIIALTYQSSWIAGGGMAFLSLAAAPWLAAHILNAPHLTGQLRLASLLLFVSTIFGPQLGVLTGFQAFRSLARINWSQGLASLLLIAVLAWGAGLTGVIVAMILANAMGGIMATRALGRECRDLGIRLNFREAWREKAILWQFSLPSFLSDALHMPVVWAANAILVNQPGGYAELGVFNAANQFRVLILFLPNILAAVTIPLLAEIHGQNDRQHFAQVANLNLRTIWIFALGVAFTIIGCSSWLMGLFGKQFADGRTILALLAGVAILQTANGTVGQSLAGSGRMWAGFVMNLFWATVLLASLVNLVHLGALGLTLAYALAYLCHTLWQLGYSWVKFGRASVQYSSSLLVLTGVAFLLAIGLRWVPEMVSITLGLCLAGIAGLWGWRLLPGAGWRKLGEIFRPA